MYIEKLAEQFRILGSQLSGQVSELKELLSESGGGRPIDTSTAGSQLMQDVKTDSVYQ
jgi:hypothetical protein